MSKVSLKEINKLAIPAILSGIIEPLISMTDTAMAGHLPQQYDPETALGAVGLAGTLISSLIWMLAQTKSAITAYISKGFGAKTLQRLRPLFAQLFWFNILLSLAIVAIVFLSSNWIFSEQGAIDSLLDTATEFTKIRIWGIPFTLMTFTIFGLFRGLQNTSWAMVISIIGGLLNIGLDYVFTYVLDYGVNGLAYASLIAQIVMFLLALGYFYKKTNFYLHLPRRIHPMFKPLLLMSFNFFLRTFFLNIAFFVANTYATNYGKLYLDVQSILVQIWLFSAFLLDGYCSAATAISGRLLGNKDIVKLNYLTKDLIKVMLGVSFIIMFFYGIGYLYISHLFTNQESIIDLFLIYFWVVILMQPINAIAFLFDGIFKGLGEAKLLRNILFIATILGFLPTIYILDKFDLKLYAVWAGFFVWMCVRSFGLLFIFKNRYKIK